MAIVARSLDLLRLYVGSFAWAPFVAFSKAALLSQLSKIRAGQLVVTDENGEVTVCGASEPSDENARTELLVAKEAFWVRVVLFADMVGAAMPLITSVVNVALTACAYQGFAESFMLGEISSPDLVAFFRIFILNRAELSNATTITSSITSTITGFARRTNTLANSQLNVSAHYDISNAMFAAFLSEDMTYSCPIWRPASDPGASKESLEEAQDRKLQKFIDSAKLKATDHVLEIGTGWGSFAIAAVRQTGCRITSLTLSREQKELAEERIAAAGLTERIEILLCDYRALPMPTAGPYDKVVSIEMLEAVGREFLDTYFGCINKLLKPEGGIGVFQCITMPETRYESYSKSQDFIRKYIFPGGHLPTVSQLVGSIERGSSGTLVVDEVINIGGHYAKTLRLWREKFERNFESKIRPALLEEHEGMTQRDVDLFRRKWQYYFTYCEAGFNTKTLGDVIITVGREGAMEMLEGIPL